MTSFKFLAQYVILNLAGVIALWAVLLPQSNTFSLMDWFGVFLIINFICMTLVRITKKLIHSYVLRMQTNDEDQHIGI